MAAVDAVDPRIQWYATVGSSSSTESAYSTLYADDGGFIIAGSTSTPSNGLDFYLAKLSSNGTVEWERTYGGYADDCAYSVARSGDGGYVLAGYTKSFGAGNSDIMLLKTDGAGAQKWFVTFGGARDDVAQSIQQTADGGFIVAGGSRSFDASGSYDAYLIKTDSSGNLVWNRTFGGADYDYANCVQQTADGGFIVAGGTGLFLSYVKDVLLIKTDALGIPQWTKTLGGSGPDNANSVRQTSDGGYILAGSTRSYGGGSEDAYMIKTDASGGLVWYNFFGGGNTDRANSAIQTTDGDYLFVGSTWSYGSGLSDVYLVKVDQSGNLVTMKTFGGIVDDHGYDVAQLQDGSCIIVGDTKSYSATLNQDIYFIRTNVFIDFLPPQMTQTSPIAGSRINDPLPTINASFYDITGVNVTSVLVTLDASDITSSCTITPDGFSYFPPSPLAEGVHTVSVTASDENGIAGTSSWSFTVDTLAPVISGLTPANRSSISSTKPLITASFDDSTGVNVSGVAVRLDLMDITASALITGTGFQYLPASPLSQGLHTVALTVPDLTGNTAVVSWTFRVDNSAPTISSISPNIGTNIISFGDAKVAISASYSDNTEVATGSIRLTLDNVDITSKATVTATAISYTGDVGGGAHTVQLTVADAAGNISTATSNFTVTNIMPFVIIAFVILIILIVLLLLLRQRRKAKAKAPLPKWEQPPPPPPPMETYIPESDIEAPIEKVEETRYTAPIPTEQPMEHAPEPETPAPESIEEAPPLPEHEPEIAIVPETAPTPAATETKTPEKISCPDCGASNNVGVTKCWYCGRSLV